MAGLDSKIQDAREIYRQIGPWIRRYRGGMPPGVLAAIALHESGGRMSSRGDASLGEVGIFQITSSFPPEIGWPSSSRYDAEANVFLGCLEYNIEAVKMFLHAPLLVRLGSADSWKLARLAFAVGSAGTRKLITKATGMHPAHAGNVYGAIRQMALSAGGIPLGSQSADKVRKRILAVDEQWAVGARVAPLWHGPPERVPSPGNRPYTLPKAVAPYFSSTAKQLIVLGALTAGAFFLA